MARRCYCEAPITTPTVTIAGSEAHHLLHVLRVAPGMRLTLFDGSGDEFDAEVTKCGRSSVELAVLDRKAVSRELPFTLTLGVPLPKGERQRWIIEKAVELGVTRFVPLTTERSVATGEKHAGDKLNRYVIEASKQCGRNRLMEIAEPHDWSQWLKAPAVAAHERLPKLWIAHPSGRPLTGDDLTTSGAAYIAVGPEGGLTDLETAAAQAAGWELIGLGPRIMRIETAAMALVAAVTVAARE